MRTAELDGAHVEYFRGLRNPIGIKVGPAMTPEWLLELLEALDPELEPGRITVIHRMGHRSVGDRLAPLVEAVLGAGRTVLWSCDPMHGNTEKTHNGRKTRRFDNILSELEQSFDVHAELGSYQGGVHFELSGDNVTECTGGALAMDTQLQLSAVNGMGFDLGHVVGNIIDLVNIMMMCFSG